MASYVSFLLQEDDSLLGKWLQLIIITSGLIY